jgi:hypothetical protein
MISEMPIDSGYTGPRPRATTPAPRSGGGTGPRTPPPDATGAELNYIVKQIEARTPMVVKLEGGEIVRGVIEYYDRHMLKLTRHGAPSLFLRKENILYLHKDEAPRRSQPR